MTLAQARARRSAIAQEMRGIHDAATGGALDDSAQARWTALEGESTTLAGVEARAAQLDEIDRRSAGSPVAGGADSQFDALADQVGLLDVIRAGMGGTDAGAGRAREMSQELARRSGRRPEGLLWHMAGRTEQRTLTTSGSSPILPPDFRPDMFVDRLRNATRVRGLGATVLTGLTGNVTIPKRTASVAMGWVAEDTALSVGDPTFAAITLSPKHAGAISEWSRNMIMQASPSVESLARSDMAMQLAEVLDTAAVAGTGASAQPTGVLNTSGIGSVAAGTNGAAPSFDVVADLIGQVDDANADGASTGFLTNTKVRRALAKLKTSTGEPLGLDVILQGKRAAYTNLVTSAGTKGSGTGLSTLLYGNWSDLLIGVWSELDILVNPYDSTAYSKGNVQIRAMMTCDIAVRHAASFAAIVDLIA